MKRGKVFGLLFLLTLAGVLAYLSPMFPTLLEWGTLPKTPDRRVNYVIAGVTPKYSGYHQKAPEDFRGLTDTILLVQLEPKSKTVKLLSLPRDTRVMVKDYGWGKLNGANVHGGPEALVNTVEHLTHLHIDGYALLSLSALREVTDALGGIEVYVPKDMKYEDTAANLHIDLKQGQQVLSGVQLEGFTRFRKDGLGDIGRVERQQQMLKAMTAKLQSPGGLIRLPQVAQALSNNMKTTLERRDAAYLFGMLMHRPQVETFTLPGNAGMFSGTSYWEVDRYGIDTLLNDHFKGVGDGADPRGLSIAVMNLGAPDGAARRLKAKLETLGYQKVWITNPEGSNIAQTVVQTGKEGELVEALLGDMGHGQVEVSPQGVKGADMTVRLGADTPLE